MSDSTKEGALPSQNRAATYNVTKHSGRRVNWVASIGNEITDTCNGDCENPQDNPDWRLNHNSSRKEIDGDNPTSHACLDTKLKQNKEKIKQETKPSLTSLPSSTAQTQLRFDELHEQNQTNEGSEIILHIDRYLTMSSNETKSSSESSNFLRKEDTFIVVDGRSNTGVISPTEDLRLRKAMALAKANARHAVKTPHGRRLRFQSNESHGLINPRSGSHSNKPRVRAYIQNTGPKVKNAFGENIYFNWKQSENLGISSISRVPLGVRKLYEFKKKRLKHKQGDKWSIKSAPNKTLVSDKMSSQKSDKSKRSKTADLVSNDQTLLTNNVSNLDSCLPFSSSTKLKTRVAFAATENEHFKDQNADMNNECSLTAVKNEIETNQNSGLNLNDADHPDNYSDNVQTYNIHVHNCGTRIVRDSTVSLETSTSPKTPVHGGHHVEISAFKESIKHISQNTLIAPPQSSSIDRIKDSSQVPCESINKVHSGPKFKMSYLQRNKRRQETSQIDIKSIVNNIPNPKAATETADNALGFNSFAQTNVITSTKTQITSSFVLKSDEITGVQKTDTANFQATRGLHDNNTKDNNLSSMHRKIQAFDRTLGTKIVNHNANASKTSNETGHSYDKDIVEQINNDSLLCDNNSKVDDGVLKNSSVTRNLHDDIKDNSNNVLDHHLENTQNGADFKTNVITNSITSIEQSDIKSCQNVRVCHDNKNRPDLIKLKGKDYRPNKHDISLDQSKYIIKSSKDSTSRCYVMNLQNSEVSNCEEYRSSNTFNEPSQHCIKPRKDTAPVAEYSNQEKSASLRGQVTTTPADFTKNSSLIKQTKSGFQGQASRSSVHVPIKTKRRSLHEDNNRALVSDQTHDAVIVSNNRIDHSFANKSAMRGIDDGSFQLECTPMKQGSQPCVTELQQGNAVVTSHGLERPQQGVAVTTATFQVNKNSTTTGRRRKQELGLNSSLSRLTATRNNRSSEQSETCHIELTHNDLSKCSSLIIKEQIPHRDGKFSKALPMENIDDIFMIRNSGNQVVPGKQVYNARHDCQSITNGVSKEMLKLELIELKEEDKVKTPPLSINRYKNATVLPQGDSHLLSGVQQNRNMTMNDVSLRKSKTLKNVQKNKMRKTKLHSCQETKENVQRAKSRSGNRLELNLAVSANSLSKIQKRRGNSDSSEDASNANRKSINTEQIIYDRNRSAAISIGDLSKNYGPVNKGEFTSEDRITHDANVTCDNHLEKELSCDIITTDEVEKSVLSENSTCINDHCAQISSVISGINGISVSSVTNKTQTGLQLNVENKADIIQNENVKYLNGKPLVNLQHSNKKTFQSSQSRSRKQEEKRQALSLHTQNMEFRDLTNNKETQYNASTSQQLYNTQETKGNSDGGVLSTQRGVASNIINDDATAYIKGVSNSESICETSARPKTAGLSAYSKHQSDDLWSINTCEDNDDDDDQIQFIDGEQDFYKVFGYNEETAAILMATKVYPVSDSVVANSGEHGAYLNDRTKNNVIVFDSSSRNVSNDCTIDGSGNASVSGFNNAVSKGIKSKENHEFKRNDDLQKRNDQKKLAKLNTNLASNATKALDKLTSDSSKEKHKDDHGYLNIYRKYSNNRLEPVATTEAEGHPHRNKQIHMEDGFAQNSRQIEMQQQEIHDGDRMETLLISNAGVASPHSPPTTETLTVFRDIPEGNQYKARRRILSEADIPKSNMDTSQTFSVSDSISEGNLNIQKGNTIPIYDVSSPASKDSKSQVALRNQLATEKHINQTRNHRHFNNLTQYQTSSILQMSNVNEPLHSRSKINSEIRHTKNKDFIRQSRSKETSTQPELASVNPYLHAADRILSRISDTEHLIYSRGDIYNRTVTQNKFQDTSNGKNIVGSPLRRMSHPVDNVIKHAQHTSSYFVTRPRKLEPIMQMSEVKQDQK